MIKSRHCTLYIVRHGETEWNIKGILQGHTDSPLTKNGIDQAKKVGEELREVNFDAVFSSDSMRAQNTARIIVSQRNLAINTTKLLRERHFGKWEGKPYSIFNNELKEMLNEFLSLPEEKKMSHKYPDMESDEQIVSRFISFLQETAITFQGKTLLIATHGGMIRALLIHLGFGTYNEVPPHAVSNSAYLIIQTNGEDFIIKKTKGIIKQ